MLTHVGHRVEGVLGSVGILLKDDKSPLVLPARFLSFPPLEVVVVVMMTSAPKSGR